MDKLYCGKINPKKAKKMSFQRQLARKSPFSSYEYVVINFYSTVILFLTAYICRRMMSSNEAF